ncbi:MAG: A/G-specific adenine glycosylase [Lachnospiraceae bacterium]|jgi:A/G-specific adenine glycosylase|nr:A/G-specific adenine glycosylase [Lachnospiraceae bacterium]
MTSDKTYLTTTYPTDEKVTLTNALLDWYDTNKRHLPWREDPTPYRVWISEIMLQQTRVEAVKPYFERFLHHLPDVKSLSEVSEDLLLKLWEGLGYYSRARNLKRAAQQIMTEYAGQIPPNYEQLLTLSGIGAYTAGAIASIAFGLPHPAVDGNVQRVLTRLYQNSIPINQPSAKLWAQTTTLSHIPQSRPGAFNQALMELGACICVPNGEPKCFDCPLERFCLAHQAKAEREYPRKDAKKPRLTEQKTILIIQQHNKIALHKRPDKGLLRGMYEFPNLPGYHNDKEVISYLQDRGLNAIHIQEAGSAKHIFTHREWHMRGYFIQIDELESSNSKDTISDTDTWIYLECADIIQHYAIPSAFLAYMKYLYS